MTGYCDAHPDPYCTLAFVDIATARGWTESWWDITMDVAFIDIPDGPVIGIDCGLNSDEPLFECVVYERGENWWENAIGQTDDILPTTPHEEALDEFVRRVMRREWTRW